MAFSAAAIQNAGALLRKPALIGAAHGLQRRLGEIRQAGELSREAIEVEALALLAYLPPEQSQSARPAA